MIGVGIIGAGFFGAWHARAIAEIEGLRLEAVCRPEPDLVAEFAASRGGTPYTDYHALLADPRVQAVAITVPHHLHAEIACAAAEAGKHILLEKPMAPTVAECDRVIAAAARSGVALLVGHTMRFSLPCMVAHRLIESGEAGPVRFGSSFLVKLWMEENRTAWHLGRRTGGGMLLTAGIHALDRLVWLTGRKVLHVSAVVETAFHDQEADDAAMLLLRFEGGGAGQVASIGYRHGAPAFGAELVCENATLRVDAEAGVSIGRDGKWEPVPHSAEPDWHFRAIRREWQALAAAIEIGAPVPVTGADGRHVVACIEAALESGRTHREVAVA